MNFIRPKILLDLEDGKIGYVLNTLFGSSTTKIKDIKDNEKSLIKVAKNAVIVDELLGAFCVPILCKEIEGEKTFEIKDYEGTIELNDLTYLDATLQDLYITLIGEYNVNIENYTEILKKSINELKNEDQTIDNEQDNFDETEDLINFNENLEKFIEYILPLDKSNPENDTKVIERRGSFMASMNEEILYCTREKTEKILKTIITHKGEKMLSDILDDESGEEFKYYINEIWEGDFGNEFIIYDDVELELIEKIKLSYYEDKIKHFEAGSKLSTYIKRDFSEAETYYGEIGNYAQAEKIQAFLRK